jgi:hypothetical protein
VFFAANAHAQAAPGRGGAGAGAAGATPATAPAGGGGSDGSDILLKRMDDLMWYQKVGDIADIPIRTSRTRRPPARPTR